MGTIMVGVSESTSGHPAIGWAVRHARRRGDTVELVHVVDITWTTIPVDWAESALLAAEEAVRGEAQRASLIDPSVAVHSVVLIGSPTRLLAEHAASADLLVVGTHSRRAASEILLGSQATRIAAAATCPVAVIPAAGQEGTGIVVGVDGSEASAAAVAFAAAEADRYGEPLTAIYAWSAPEPWGMGESAWPTSPVEEDRRILAEAVAGLADQYPDLKVTAEVVGGRPLPALYAASVGARMLVVGTHGKHGFSKALLGSVSEDLVLSLPCPVVVVRA